MHTELPRSKLNAQIYEEACEWLVHFRAGDADHDVAARTQLDEWLRRSPEHVRAYLEVSAIWEDTAEHDSAGKIGAEAHIARALSEINVVPLEPRSEAARMPSAPRRAPLRRARVWAVAAAVAVFSAIGIVTWSQWRSTVYSTAIGEQRLITLDDGSTVELNARSRFRVRYTEQTRSVELLQGQALFRVAKDARRPFIVATDDAQVRAVGTQFDVNRGKSRTTVSVIEGRVRVDAPTAGTTNTGEKEVFLDAGQQLVITAKMLVLPQPANISAATAWTEKRLVFDSAPLSEVTEEFNRYNTRPIVIRDRSLDAFGVFGVFSSSDPSSFVTFLRAQPEIAVSESDAEISINRR